MSRWAYERLQLCHAEYQRALVEVRERPSARTWIRLLEAAGARKAAIRYCEKERQRGRKTSPALRVRTSRSAVCPRAGASIAVLAAHRECDAVANSGISPDAGGSSLAQECTWARALQERSRELVAESARLRADIAASFARWQATVESTRGPGVVGDRAARATWAGAP